MTATMETRGAWIPADTLAARLVLVRRELKLSQREAAERCGITFGSWQGMEDGERQVRGLNDKVAAISEALGVDKNWLMWGGALRTPRRLMGGLIKPVSKALRSPERVTHL
ncbi:MAG TPA: helix-turn-helix transcriptional regulator, partial [Streptosporangiaceae bacterium]